MYFGVVITGYSISFFTPTILSQLGWTAVRAQVLSIPIYVVACAVSLIAAVCSDYLQHRYAFTILGVLVATIGYILLLIPKSVPIAARYFAVYLITSGAYITQPITLIWVANNMGGHYKHSVSAAVQIGFGNVGGIVASNIFITSQAPTYPVGFGVCLGMLWLCAIMCTVLFIGLWMENRKRDRGERDHRLQLPSDELANLGDSHPSFRFAY